jgi:hypothetical protein
MNWKRRASCRDVPLKHFFYLQTDTEQVTPFVAELCGGCPVRHDCLKEALETRSVGIWAGTTTAERRRPIRDDRELRNRVVECGMYSGYQKHLRDKTPPCHACKVARNAYVTQQRRGGYIYGPTLKAN